MSKQEKAILITGGAGFIGSHLAEQLLSAGNRVVVLDDLSTGSSENVKHLVGFDRFQLVIDSVLNEKVVEKLVKSSSMVYHLAAAVGVRLIIEQPSKTIETNVLGTEMILKKCSKHLKKVLITSTSEVYGSGISERFNEEDSCIIGPPSKRRWSYAASKLIDEHLAFSYWRGKQLPIIIVRLFNVIGPRQIGRYGMVVPTFIKQALSGEPLTIFGDGTQTRSFLSVVDAVKALTGLVNNSETLGELFNIGSEEEISINDLAKIILEVTESSSSLRYLSYKDAYGEDFEDMYRRVPDISKIKEAIGFKPKQELSKIIGNMVKFLK